jgi:hypothetical protein
MPIEPPNPHRILDTLNAAMVQLQALAASEPPGAALPAVAIGSVQVAIVAVTAIAGACDPPTGRPPA